MPGTASEHMKDHVIVRAGAGAGKTRRLTFQVIETADAFHAKEGRYPRMIVTTFTRKATQELRERLMLKALEDDSGIIDFVNSRSHLVVSTIHGVLDIYLKRYGGNICMDPGYTVMGSSEAGRLSRQALRSVLVADDRFQPLLEIYGFNRLVDLVRKYHETILRVADAKPDDEETLRVIFADHAKALAADAFEVSACIEEESDNDDWRRMALEIRSVAHRLDTEDWVTARDSIIGEISAIKTARWNTKKPPLSEETNDASKDILGRLKKLKEDFFDPACWRDFASTFALFDEMGREFSKEFSQAKVQQGAIEISDLELMAMKCMTEHPQTVEAFAQEWDYWLIDEYQDTSPFQVELIRKLSGDRPNFIVGDPQQSIYLFRGARSEVFGDKEAEVLSGGGQQDFLRKNYRSTPELLLFFNDLFGRFEPPFKPMEPNLAEGAEVDPQKLVARIIAVPEVEDEGAEPVDREMLSLVRHVQDLLAAGALPEDICVLGRTNQTLLDVASWLDRYRLPTHVHAASGFYTRRETMDALALLKFLVNPHDNYNTVQLLRSPWFRVADELLVRAFAAKEGSHWDRICRAEEGSEFESIRRLQAWLEARSSCGIGEAFRRALVEAGFVDLSHFHDVSGRRESNVWKLLTKLAQDEGAAGFNYLDFIENAEVDLRESSGAEESDAIAAVEPDRINLMTVHSSKGLQFKHVILPRMGQKPRLTLSLNFTFDENRHRWALRVPRGEALDMTASLAEKAWLETFRKQELQEHARVLYVALTRASESVFMSWSGRAQPESWASMLRWNLDPGRHAGTSYSYEVSLGLPDPDEAKEVAAVSFEPRPAWYSDSRSLPGQTPSRIQRNVSVSQMLERSLPLKKTYDAVGIPTRLRLASQGTAVHRLMEALKSPAAGSVRQMIQRWFPDQEEKVLAAVNFVTGLEDPPLARLIREGCVEWGFAFLENGTFVEGQIDLWGRIEGPQGATVWVVDYKTGNPEGKEKAFHQLALYSLALQKAGEIGAEDRVKLAAVYPFAEKVFVQDEPTKSYYKEHFPL